MKTREEKTTEPSSRIKSERCTHNQPSMWPMTGQLLCYSDSRAHSAFTFVPITFHSVLGIHFCWFWLLFSSNSSMALLSACAVFGLLFACVLNWCRWSSFPCIRATSTRKKGKKERIKCNCAFLWTWTRCVRCTANRKIDRLVCRSSIV